MSLCQFGLAVVEGPEAIRLEFERTGDVQGVEGSHRALRPKFAGELAADFKSVLRDWYGQPTSGGAVFFQFGADPLRFRQR